jgi:hypothetical protein
MGKNQHSVAKKTALKNPLCGGVYYRFPNKIANLEVSDDAYYNTTNYAALNYMQYF